MFGSERILSREHLALTQASQTIQSYGFADALADQKALVEALTRLLGAPAPICWIGSRRAPCGSGCCAAGPATRSCIGCPVPPAVVSSPARPI